MPVRVELPPPPTTRARAGGGGGEWIELVRAANDIEAHLLIGRLNETGIETRAIKDRRAPGAWIYAGANPWAPVSVLVRRVQADDARLVLAEISFAAPPRAPDRLEPSSSSGWRVALTWWVVALALGILLSLIALMQMANLASACDRGTSCARPYGAAP